MPALETLHQVVRLRRERVPAHACVLGPSGTFMGRFVCNTLQEAKDSAGQVVGGRTRDFDAIVVGGGTFGSVVAEHLFIADNTRSRRILVLEAGPFVLPEHVQNMPFVAPASGAPDMRVPWVNHPALNYAGLLFAIGGRSLTWGGWSPEPPDVELAAWPASTRAEMRARYFAEASRQIGVKETNDFIYGPLHTITPPGTAPHQP